MKQNLAIGPIAVLLVWSTGLLAEQQVGPVAPSESAANHAEDGAEIDPANPQNWGIYTREFRKEHQFALTVGLRLTHWEIEGLGDLPPYVGERKGVYEQFTYSYHLHFFRKTGFVLGSTLGYQRALHEFEGGFAPPEDVSFPGVLFGFAYDANPRSRGGITSNYFLERWNAMRSETEADNQPSLHITVEVLELSAFVDFFFDLHWAMRMEAKYRESFFHRPRSPENTPMDIRVSRRDQGYGLGMVYHLL